MLKNFIEVNYQCEGIHRWKDCQLEGVEFLQDYHRHIFHIKVRMEVFHNDREVEIILLKRFLESYTQELLSKPVDLSCEAMALSVYHQLAKEYIQSSKGN